jgi:hypothetical protein
VHGRSDAYRLELVRPDGTLDRVITRNVQPEPVTEEATQRIREMMTRALHEQLGGQPVPAQMLSMLENMEFAETFPLLQTLLGGPGNTIWVLRTDPEQAIAAQLESEVDDLPASSWDVFDADGRMLGAFDLPPRFTPLRVVGDDIYGIERDSLNVSYVVQLRVLPPQ